MKQKHNKKNRRVITSAAELSKYESLIRPVIEKIVMTLGFHLVEVSFTNENQENYLRITVMHEEHPVSTNDCEIISRGVGKELDSLDLIPFPYIFEVQSRGMLPMPLERIDEDAVQNNFRHEFVLEKTGLTVRS